jgi:hypothetical protein
MYTKDVQMKRFSLFTLTGVGEHACFEGNGCLFEC